MKQASRGSIRHRHALGLLGGLVVLALVLWKAHPGEVLAAVRAASVGWLALAIGFKTAALGIKIARWQLSWTAAFGARGAHLASATVVGYFLNGTVPARLGDLVRVRVASRANAQSFSAVLGSLALDKALDAVLLGGIFAATAASMVVPRFERIGWLAALTVLFPVAVVGLVFTTRLERFAPSRLQAFIERFRLGLSALRSLRTVALCIVATVAAWAAELMGTYLVLLAFRIAATPAVVLILTTAVALGLSVPSAPSGLGVHQAIYVACLSTVGASTASAVAASLCTVGLMLAVLAVGSWIAMMVEGVSWPDLLMDVRSREVPR